ncbi:MAG TPA: VWA domain-containing protein [Vicinamibacterales bacterium]|nr:VWA domain-containing protein [Vicinamibacterales bacterium]
MHRSPRARLARWLRPAAVALCLVALAAVGRAQQGQPAPAQPAQPQQPAAQTPAGQPAPPVIPGQDAQPVFRGGINFVRVDVIATDGKQQPVLDLKQDEFEVLEDNQPQTVEQFRLIKVDGNPKVGDPPPRVIRNRDDEETEAARDDVRVFAILLDDYHVRRANSVSVREPLTKFIQTQLRPNDMVAVMYPLTPITDLSFTRDHEKIIGAINAFEGRKYDYRPRNQLEENYVRYPTDTVERIRNEVVMGALRGLSVRLGSLREGRKSVIFVSEGFTAILPPQMRRQDASQPENPLQAGAAGRLQDSSVEETAAWFGQSDVNMRMREVYQMANRNNTSIYSLDPRGLAVFEFGLDDSSVTPSFATDRRVLNMTQDTLRSLSEETDGRAIVNRNTLYEGLQQMVRDSSYYYLIGYSSKAPTDGKFHDIKVRIKRRGVEARARRGYWAATANDVLKASTPAKEVAKPVLNALATLSGSIQSKSYVRTWVGTEKGAGGKTRVTLVWEPSPLPPGARRDPPGAVAVLAATEKGDLVYRGRSSLPGTPGAGSAGTAPLPAGAGAGAQRLTFEAPPGKLELRLTIEGTSGAGTLDREDRTIEVPDLTAPQVAISTPRVFRARTARDVQTITADGNATPVIGREFSRAERLVVRFDVYAAGTDMPKTTATLLNRNGDKMADLPVVPATAGGTHAFEVGLNTIPSGEYLIQIDSAGASGTASEVIAIRVGA